jgi:hypothetical protein
MCFTDVKSVVEEMRRSSNMGRVSVADYEFVVVGRNMLFHATQRNITLALLFCTGAACRLLQFSGPKALASAVATAKSSYSYYHICGSAMKLQPWKQLPDAMSILSRQISVISHGCGVCFGSHRLLNSMKPCHDSIRLNCSSFARVN